MQLSFTVFCCSCPVRCLSLTLYVARTCCCGSVCPLQFPQGSWSPPQQTDDFATLWLKHLLQPLTPRDTHPWVDGRSCRRCPTVTTSHKTLTSTHTHHTHNTTHTHTPKVESQRAHIPFCWDMVTMFYDRLMRSVCGQT